MQSSAMPDGISTWQAFISVNARYPPCTPAAEIGQAYKVHLLFTARARHLRDKARGKHGRPLAVLSVRELLLDIRRAYDQL
jgi:hypothetical protein